MTIKALILASAAFSAAFSSLPSQATTVSASTVENGIPVRDCEILRKVASVSVKSRQLGMPKSELKARLFKNPPNSELAAAFASVVSSIIDMVYTRPPLEGAYKDLQPDIVGEEVYAVCIKSLNK